jgi:flagellar biosynthesis protein FlhA
LTIVETLADYGTAIQDPAQLTEYVRSRMGRTILKPYLASDGSLPILTLDPEIDQLLNDSLRQTDQGAYLAMEPGLAQRIIQNTNQTLDNAVGTDGTPVLLVAPHIRTHLAQLTVRFLPTLPVISQAEIPADVKIHSLAVVKLS